MKILNLYAGIGGNRKLWGDAHEITAVEYDEEIAQVYKHYFPNDKVIIDDAETYLLNHFQEFDFIWASPPCPTHSRLRTLWSGDGKLKNKTSGSSFKIPDMRLYGIIIFLQHFYKGDWVVENVISYYSPLIKPYIIDNHYFWSNKFLPALPNKKRHTLSQDLELKNNELMFNLDNFNVSTRKKRTMLNNCVKPITGLRIFEEVTKPKQTLIFGVQK